MYINLRETKLRKAAFSILSQVVVTAHLISDNEVVTQLELPTLSKQLFEILAKTETSKTSIKQVVLFLLHLFLYIFFLVRNKFLILLGRLAQYFPYVLEENAGRVTNQLIYELEKEV